MLKHRLATGPEMDRLNLVRELIEKIYIVNVFILIHLLSYTNDILNVEFYLKILFKNKKAPPLNGGLEPRTYFRDHTVLLGDQKIYDDPFLNNDLQRQAHERQLNRINAVKIIRFLILIINL